MWLATWSLEMRRNLDPAQWSPVTARMAKRDRARAHLAVQPASPAGRRHDEEGQAGEKQGGSDRDEWEEGRTGKGQQWRRTGRCCCRRRCGRSIRDHGRGTRAATRSRDHGTGRIGDAGVNVGGGRAQGDGPAVGPPMCRGRSERWDRRGWPRRCRRRRAGVDRARARVARRRLRCPCKDPWYH